MADAAPKEKKKKKTEGKKSDQPTTKKGDASVDVKEKTTSRKASATPDNAPKPTAANEGDKKGEKKSSSTPDKARKPSTTPDPGRKPSSTPDPGRKPSTTPDTAPSSTEKPSSGIKIEVSVDETITAKPKPILKVSNVEVEIEEAPPKPLTPVATVEIEGDSLEKGKPKPIANAEVEIEESAGEKEQRLQPDMDEEPPEVHRKGSYVAPKAATKRDVDLLFDLDIEKLAELKEAFHLFDLNNDGFIDKEDLKNTYITLGRPDVRDEEIQQMLSEAINPLDFDSFVVLLGYKTIELDPEEVLREALSQWDYDESGLISEDRIKHDLMMWGDRFTPEEVEMALEDAPVFAHKVTGVSMIDYVKFCKILCGLRKKPKSEECEAEK